jgi:2-keto-myo-inositol isomerase
MIPCINQATVMKVDTIQFIEAAGKHSFSHIELDIDRLEASIKKEGLPKLKMTLRNNGIKVVSLNAIDNYPIASESEISSSLGRSEEVLKLCSDVEAEILVVNPANFRSPSEEKLMERNFDAFIGQVSKLSEKYGVKIGYEYVSYSDKVVNTLSKSLEGLERWGGGIYLVLDVFHMYRSNETIEDLPENQIGRLVAFHVNDAPKIEIEKLVDTDRVLPLDGVIGVQGYVNELKRRGYAGPVSVELFNHVY